MTNCFNAPKLVIKSHKIAPIDVEKLAYARLLFFLCHNSICFLPSAKIEVSLKEL